jgi:thioredoxin reductase (NADPH)
MEHQKAIVIIGSGPAAHTAAIYTARAGIRTVLFEGAYCPDWTPGGQLMTTTDLENFPGFPDGVNGPDFCMSLAKQSSKFGTEIRSETVVGIKPRPSLEGGGYWIKSNGGTEELADAVIVATGATAKTLEVPGKDRLWNKGISACAVCDGALPQFRNKTIVVIGGGDSAMEEALFLTRYASDVLIVHRRDTFRASKIMQQRVLNHPKISVSWNTELVQALGDTKLEAVELRSGERQFTTPCAGLFFAIGHQPNSDFLGDLVELDRDGYIIAVRNHTSRVGIFAAGDVQDKIYRQAITAAGSGCTAALECIRYLEE